MAIGSFVEEYNNKVQIVSLDEEVSEFSPKSTFDHPYPTTKIMWIPDSVRVAYYTMDVIHFLNIINKFLIMFYLHYRKEYFPIY